MLLLLDANALNSDPACCGSVWGVLATAPSDWNLRVAVTEVALIEAAAKYEAQVAAARSEMSRVLRKWTRLGLPHVDVRDDAAGQQAGGSYERQLRQYLGDANVEVIAPADVPHLEIVRRAAARRRPCDEKGDGYRDTLNWLTVLRLAAEQPEGELVVWVTNDSDFSGDERTELHPHLLDDLDASGLRGRVRLALDLWTAVQQLAAEFSSDADDMRALRASVHKQTVLSYLQEQIPQQCEQLPLSPRACALPVGSLAAAIHGVGALSDLTFEFAGGVGQDQVVGAFQVNGQTTIHVDLPNEAANESDRGAAASTSESALTVVVEKRLLIRGAITFNRLGRPLGLEVTEAVAPPEDPGLDDWAAVDRRTRPVGDYSSMLKLWAESMKPVQFNLISPEMREQWKLPAIDFNIHPAPDILGVFRQILESFFTNYKWAIPPLGPLIDPPPNPFERFRHVEDAGGRVEESGDLAPDPGAPEVPARDQEPGDDSEEG